MRIPTLLSAAALAGATLGQTTGTEHWLAYMENLDLGFNGPPSFTVVVSSDTDTEGDLTFPATGFTIPFNVEAGHDTVLTLPTNIYYPEGDEDIVNFGMRITADAPVSVYAYHNRTYFSEAAMVLPYTLLSTEYMVLAHEDALGTDPSEFVVLATADSTAIEIVPSILTMGFRPPGEPFTILLDKGQVFQVQAIGDLTGTQVRSLDPAKRIAVFSGARQANVGCEGSADDHLYNQALPQALWSIRHIAVPFKNRGGDEYRILSSADGNIVTVGGNAPVLLSAGEVHSVQITGVSTIIASAPVTVGQFNESQSCNPALGDPCFLWNLPTSLRDTRFIWSSLNAMGTPEHYVNIVVPGAASAPPVFLDGMNIANQFAPVPGTPGSFYAQATISEGEHELTCDAGAWAAAYGFGDYNSYAFSLGYEEGETTDIGTLLPERANTGNINLREGDALSWAKLPQMWARLDVFEPSGKLVSTFNKSDASAPISLRAGLYLYRAVIGGAGVQSGRLVVQP